MSTVSQRKKTPTLAETFLGFPSSVDSHYTQIPNKWFEIIQKIDNLAELKVVLYVIRHTWGFRDEDGEREESKWITVDEFAYGRKHRDGTRMDSGTGLGITTVKDGIKRAVDHDYLLYDTDSTDLARVRKSYGLNLLEADDDSPGGHVLTSDSQILTTGGRNVTTGSQNPTSSTSECDPRSEKETPETNSSKETEKKDALSPFFLQAFSFVKTREQVNFLELEKYMHRFIRVRGKTPINLKRKNLVAWTGASQEFLQIILDLQAHKQVSIDFGKESDYSPKGRKPRLPVATVEKDYEEMHWYPMVIVYRTS